MNMRSCALICSISRSADERSSCEVQIPNSSFKHIIAPAIHPPSSCHFNLVKVIMKVKVDYFPQIWKWKTRKPSLSSFKHIPYHTLNLKSCLFYLIKAMMNVKMINMKFHPPSCHFNLNISESPHWYLTVIWSVINWQLCCQKCHRPVLKLITWEGENPIKKT